MTPRLVLRLLAVPLIVGYAWLRLGEPDYWDVLDDLNLAVHEAGHLVFQPLGDHPMTIGGSVFQILVPLAFAIYFARRRQRFAASVVMAWVAVNLLNVARYIGDSRAQELPLLGGENAVHDWWYLLTEWDLIGQDLAIARAVRAVATLVWVVAGAGALAFARENPAPSEELAPAAGD